MTAFRAAVFLYVVIKLLPFNLDPEHAATMATGLGEIGLREIRRVLLHSRVLPPIIKANSRSACLSPNIVSIANAHIALGPTELPEHGSIYRL